MHMRVASAILAAGLLAACGGGSGDGGETPPPSPPPGLSAKGLWTGTGGARQVTGLVLGDGRYYFFYGTAGTASPSLAGLVQGSSTIDEQGRFHSSDGLDFDAMGLGLAPVVVMSTSLGTRQFLQGFAMYPLAISFGFDLQYDPDFEARASLSAVAGTYAGTAVTLQGRDEATLVASATGALSGTDARGCHISGQLAPRSDGNAFDASLLYGPSPCRLPGMAFSGVAYWRASSRTLWLTGVNGGRTQALSFVGS